MEKKEKLNKITDGYYELVIETKGSGEFDEPVSQDMHIKYTKEQIKEFYANLKNQIKTLQDEIAKERKKIADFEVDEKDIDFEEVERYRKAKKESEYLTKKENSENAIENLKKTLETTKTRFNLIEKAIPETKRKK